MLSNYYSLFIKIILQLRIVFYFYFSLSWLNKAPLLCMKCAVEKKTCTNKVMYSIRLGMCNKKIAMRKHVPRSGNRTG